MTKTNLLGCNARALADFLGSLGERPFRVQQLLRWIHRFGVDDFSAMSDLSKELRQRLKAIAVVDPPAVLAEHEAADGTRKWLLETGTGNAVETVFIPETGRGTLCVSTQVGCALACRFCSTGRQGFNRNLTAAEIVGQLWWANKALGDLLDKEERRPRGSNPPRSPFKGGEGEEGRAITNVVLMGMGEPLLNLDNVVPALELMLDDHAYGLSRRRVTISTSGIVPAIDRLRQLCPVALAVSLHAPTDRLRDELMPINRKYPLSELMAACRRYVEDAPRDFITFEYVMLAGVNDSVEHARAAVRLTRGVPCKFNLIPFNPFPDSGFRRSPPEAILAFQKVLMDAGIVATVRKARGEDIAAACGQLAGRVVERRRASRLAEVAS